MSKLKLEDLYLDNKGKVSDKWGNYLPVYDRIFADYRDKTINLLEIGIQNGGSLEIWSKFFPLSKIMVGCDINPDCGELKYDDSRIVVVVGDANSDEVKTDILRNSNTFDIIVDDGSHRSADIVKSFANYFPQLANEGLYVAEDLHCSYWQEFEGGLYDPYSSVAFFKKLADILNYEHWGFSKTRTEILAGFFDKYKIRITEDVLAGIHSVEFVNSICIIKKKAENKNRQGERLFSGVEEQVVVRGTEVRSLVYEPPSQAENPWTARSTAPEEDTLRLETENVNLSTKIDDKEMEIFELTNQINLIKNNC